MRTAAVEDSELAQRIDCESGQVVIQVAAHQLYDQTRNTGVLAFGVRGQQAQAVKFHGKDARLQLQEPVAIDGIVHQSASVDLFFHHQIDDRLEARLRLVGI